VSRAAPEARDGTAVGCGALTVAVAVSHGMGGEPAFAGRTGADESAVGVALRDVVLAGVGEAVGETDAGADDEPEALGDEEAAEPDPLEQAARPASRTSATPAPALRGPRQASSARAMRPPARGGPIGESAAVTGREATATPAV
jgi:hypothetical protein